MGQADNKLAAVSQQLVETVAYNSTTAVIANTFTFPSVPQGFTWTGTLNCSNAPTGAVFTITIGGVPWGQWGGNSVYGPVQAQSMQQIIVTATGLTPGENYLMTMLGSSDPANTVAAIWPDTNSTALTAQISGTVATTVTNTVSTNTNVTGGSLGSVTSITNQVSTNAGGVDTLLASFGYTTLPATSATFLAARNYLGFAMNFSGDGATVPGYIQITNVTQGTNYNWYKPSVYPADPTTVGTSGGLWFCPLQANSGDTLQISALGTTGAATGNIELWGYVTSAQVFVEPAPNRSFDVVSYGGNVVASGNASTTGSTTLLPAVTGYAYALHMVTCICSASTETNNLYDLVTSGNPFYDGGLNVGTYNQFFYGMLVQSVTLQKAVVTTTQWNIHYALVRNPTII